MGAGKTILITGATDGLGKGLAIELAPTGARLVLLGRSDAKGRALLAELGPRSTGELHWVRADLASLGEVRNLADDLLDESRLDVLVNNAGIGTHEPGGGERVESADGHELRFAVNYLDDVMLEHSYNGIQAYCQSKLALVMLTFDLAEELEGSGVTANCLHPGTYMPTKMVVRAGIDPVTPLEEGVAATRRLVDSNEVEDTNGHYFDGARDSAPHPQADDPDARRRLRELSAELTGVPASA